MIDTRHGANWFSSDLIEILPAAVYVCDADAVVVAFNSRATELWGRTPNLGDTDQRYCGAHRLFRVDGTHLPHQETPMEWVLRTGEAARDQEVIIERPDGSRVTVLVNIAPLFDESGALIGAVNCFQDLTSQKESEKERVKLREELHQAQKVQALGQLIGGFAHDFNNLLTAISGSLELMRRRLATGRIDGVGRYMDAASTGAARAAALSHRLLAFARRQSLDIKSTDVNVLVAGLKDMLRRTLGENITFETVLRANLWSALTDANELESALLNLVINARDAMPEGGRLTIETTTAGFDAASAHLTDGVEVGEYVVISVSDTGSGMSREVIARAFDPFFTTKPIGQGTGLGLSTTYGFVKQSGGHVRIQSKAGEGTRVTLYLPRATHDEGRRHDVSEAAALRGRGEMVLVVEDDETVRSVMTEALDELGYRYSAAADAQAAIPLLESAQPIHLLVTDVGMPNMDGRQLADIARQHRPHLKVLFVSGYAKDAAMRGDFLAPGMEMMSKPFAITALAAKIRELIDDCAVPATLPHGRQSDTQVNGRRFGSKAS